jgi:hypothetical protein
MPQVPTSPDHKAPASNNAPRPLLVPPEEQFWKRYSPHHEFPLSSATSVALHVLGLGILLVLAYVLWSNRAQPPADVPQMDVVLPESADLMNPGGTKVTKERAGGGRGGRGGKDEKGGEEDVGDEKKTEEASGNPYAETLEDPAQPPPPVPVGSNLPTKDGTRTIVDGDVPKELGNMAKKSYRVLARRGTPKKSKPSKDSGGGAGGDKGRGRDSKYRDSGRGGGRGNLEQVRAQRQLRWKVLFSTSSGRDYQDQLYALRAILVIAEPKPGPGGMPMRDARGQVLLMYRKVIRDLSQSPAPVQNEDVRKIPGIFWIDDKPESVRELAQSLGLPQPPPLIAAFFPTQVERELRALEKRKYGGPEYKIYATVFRVVPSSNGKYQGTRARYNLICQAVQLNGR